jgi:hypothetical protein
LGKLHTLRRAVGRDPERWMLWPNKWRGARVQDAARDVQAYGARFRAGNWEPTSSRGTRRGSPYRGFVRHVLRELGYACER